MVERVLGRRRGAGADRREPPAARGQRAGAGRCGRGDRARARARVLPAALRGVRRRARAARAPRQRAVAAVHRARRRRATTRSATRRSTRASPARSPRRRRACISTRRCWRRCAAAASTLAYVTLHVGAGTFQPVRVQDLAQHEMHGEWYDVPQATVDAISRARGRGGRVLAVGTTTLRALESAAAGGDAEGRARRDPALHPARLPLPRGRAPAHQLPPAEVHAAHAGVGVRRHG